MATGKANQRNWRTLEVRQIDADRSGDLADVLDFFGVEAEYEHLAGSEGFYRADLTPAEVGLLLSRPVPGFCHEFAVYVGDELPVECTCGAPGGVETLATLRTAVRALGHAADEIAEVAEIGIEVDRGYWSEGGDGYEVQRRLWDLITGMQDTRQ